MKKSYLWNMEFSICHRRPDRSFFWRGKQFPLCARCTGIVLGFLVLPLYAFQLLAPSIAAALLLQLPAYADGTSQALGWRSSNNILRLITGFLCGWGQMALAACTGNWIIQVLGLPDKL